MKVELAWKHPQSHGFRGLGDPDFVLDEATGYESLRSGVQRGFHDLGIPYDLVRTKRIAERLEHKPLICDHAAAVVEVDGQKVARFCQVRGGKVYNEAGHIIRPIAVGKLRGHPCDGISTCIRGTKARQWGKTMVPDYEPDTSPPLGLDRIRLCVGLAQDWMWEGADLRIGLTMWESSRLPDHLFPWTRHLAAADYVVVPTPHNANLVTRQAGKKAVIVPLGIHEEMWPWRDRRVDRPKSRPFTILLAGQMGWRKGWAYAYDAFAKAFGQDMGARLIIKTRPPSQLTYIGQNDESGKLDLTKYRHMFDDPNVFVFRQPWSRERFMQLMYMADCFIWPSLGEGWGLPPREATLTGLPTLTTWHTGMYDADRWAWQTLGHNDAGPAAVFRPWGRCGVWKRPNVDDLAAAMVRTRERYDDAVEHTREVGRPYLEQRRWSDVVADILSKTGAMRMLRQEAA